jgi:hypothetical protein
MSASRVSGAGKYTFHVVAEEPPGTGLRFSFVERASAPDTQKRLR